MKDWILIGIGAFIGSLLFEATMHFVKKRSARIAREKLNKAIRKWQSPNLDAICEISEGKKGSEG